MITNKLFLCTLTSVFLLLSACQQSAFNPDDVSVETKIDSVSYSLGYLNGQSLDQQGMGDIDLDALMAGFHDAFNKQDPNLTEQDMRIIVQRYQMQKQQEAQQAQQEEAQKNLRQGQEFLESNKEKEGVQVTDSGLQYQVMEEGTGASPTPEDSVQVHYKGMHLDGTVFDSSYERGEPAEFPLNGVIKGWTEGVSLMKEGAKYKFWIPANLAYGTNPRPGGPIGPNEVLVFEVELLEVK